MTTHPAFSAARRALALPLLATALLCCSKSNANIPDAGAPDAGAPDAGAPDAGYAGVTVHYHRALADYDGWQAQVTPAGGAASALAAAGKDGFGAFYEFMPASGTTAFTVALTNAAATDAAGTLNVDLSGGAKNAWIISGFPEAITRQLPALPDATHDALYYVRADQTYTGWGLHLWGDQAFNTQYGTPILPAGIDPEFGAGFLIPLMTGSPPGNCAPGSICLIAHNGGTKDPGPDMSFDPAKVGNFVFLTSGSTVITTLPARPAAGNAHLIARDTLAWKIADPSAKVELRYSATAALTVTANDVTGGSVISLTENPAGLSTAQKGFAPYLTGYRAFTVAAADLTKLQDALKGQLLAVARTAAGAFISQSAVQTAWALDDLYSYDGELGVTLAADNTPTFNLWAPTAQSVKLHVFDANKVEVTAAGGQAMTVSAQGVWSFAGVPAWVGDYYRYEIVVYHPASGKIETLTVTDPYSVNLDTNGLYSQIVDLANDATLQPTNWKTFTKPALGSVNDIVLYEAHMRDFSALDHTVVPVLRGKYKAFTTPLVTPQSNGLKHLQALAAAGLTHLHILPVFDIATIDEDPANRVDLDQPFSDLCAKNANVPLAMCTQYGSQTIAAVMASLPPDSQDQQTIAFYLKNLDSFNWGYDPFHYGAPEGSYASTAEGTAKVLEFRQMVKGLSDIGLRIVMDVVYNHTNAAGPTDKHSVLDKVVPGYYHRLDPNTGAVYNSTCCSNTATEHHMMEKLMTDTLVRWARDYKVDGFRFDLMGHQPKAAMQRVLAKLNSLTLANDGVDGSKIYLYGEGWDFGEVQNGVLFPNASQINMAGTGIGTFNDRVRDAIRGGGPFDSGAAIRANQGFASGLYVDPNESSGTSAKDTLGNRTDWIKLAMAANLADFKLVTYAAGAVSTGHNIDYNGAPAGYTGQPQEVINYAAAHDNQDLFDILQTKLPTGMSMANRVRNQNLALDVVLLGQGIPFVHMGDDVLRSKSEDGNSYDSGDWFNRIDWTGQSNGWASGLPQSGDNFNNWLLINSLFHDTSIAPAAPDIAAASAHFQELLAIRKSSKLFRLGTHDDVLKRVDFLNAGPTQVPGLIVMTVTDGTCAGADLDPQRDALVAILNATTTTQTVTVPGATGFTLHSVQQGSADSVVKMATASGTTFTVPGRTSAVFEQLQSGAQGAGLACNTH